MKFSYRLVVLVTAGSLACILLLQQERITSDVASTNHVRRKENGTGHGESSWSVRGAWHDGDIMENATRRSGLSSTSEDTKVTPLNLDTWDLFKRVDRKYADRFKYKRNGDENKDAMDSVLSRAKDKLLQVIVIPNSHNDPGWLKTLQGYYNDQTRHILNSMVEKLKKYPKMTFIWAESVFLELWWSELEPELKEDVRRLIEQHQLEIVGGGWVVPDEANPTYHALIDQLIEGHQWLEHTLMVKPNNSWSLDPFGYSSTLAYIYQKAGFQNMAIQRVNQDVKKLLQEDRMMEFRLRQHWDESGQTDMFTLVMPGKVYDISDTCGPDKRICSQFDFRKIKNEKSDPKVEFISGHNVERQAKKLLGQYYKKAMNYKHNALLVPVGGDFRFDEPLEWDQQYKNYQMLFNYMNSRPEWNVIARFGTVQDYFDAVREELRFADLPTMTGDFFPYTDAGGVFWTGYFSTRPFQKKLGRHLEHSLRTADLLYCQVMTMMILREEVYSKGDSYFELLQYAHRSLGLFQHHDAITGTARPHVVKDYEDRLIKSINNTNVVISNTLQSLLGHEQADEYTMYSSASHATQGTDQLQVLSLDGNGCRLIIFNPLARDHHQIVRILVDSDHVAVFDEKDHSIPSQLNPFWTDDGAISSQTFELLFYVRIPALSRRVYKLIKVPDPGANDNVAATVTQPRDKVSETVLSLRFFVSVMNNSVLTLENGVHRLGFSPRSGALMSITEKHSLVSTKVSLQFLAYKSHGSGAYIFSPAGPALNSDLSLHPVVRTVKGPLVSEIHSMQKAVHHRVRLFKTASVLDWAIEVDNVVDLRGMDDRELVMRFTTSVADAENHFYVDANSLHMRKRERFTNYPLQANFYPMNSVTYLDDTNQRFSVFSAQPHGCASLAPGQLDIMLDRRLTHDDGKGLDQGVMDNRRISSQFYFTLERKLPTPEKRNLGSSFPSMLGHTLNEYLNRPLIVTFTRNSSSQIPNHSKLSSSVGIPCDLKVVLVRPLERVSVSEGVNFAIILHRLSYQSNFSEDMLDCPSNTGKFSLKSLLPPGLESKVHSVKEMTLSLLHEKRSLSVYTPITLRPMDMVAYKITIQTDLTFRHKRGVMDAFNGLTI